MPYVGLHQHDNGTITLDRGIFVEVLEELSRLLNFSYTVSVPPDGKWGALEDDGSWSGMVGQLQREILDIGLHLRSCEFK